MGCDGGSIPRRDELVKLKKKEEKPDPNEVERIKWSSCSISKEPLKDPIVACDLGYLYNKDAVIRNLLEKTMDEAFQHIRNLKDLITVRFTPNPAYVEKNGDDNNVSPFICPITLTEVGRSRFSLLKTCGCVLSERALHEVPSTTCLQCGKPFTQDDILPLNPPQDELEQLRKVMMEKRAAEREGRRKSKKEKKEKKEGKKVVVDGKASVDGKADGRSSGSSEEDKVPDKAKILAERESLRKRPVDTTTSTTSTTATTTTTTTEPPTKMKKTNAYASIFTSSIKPKEGERITETFMCRNVLRG